MKRRLVLAVAAVALAACTPSTTDTSSAPAAPPQPDLAAATPPSGPAAPNTPDTLSTTTPAATPALSPAATPAQLADGRAAYIRVCAMCHGPKGEGVPNLGVALTVRDPALIREKDTKGQVKDGDKMPPMVGMLQGEELDDVALFVAAGLPQ